MHGCKIYEGGGAMFGKERTENKAHMAPAPDVITDPYGKVLRKSDFEDGANPGRTIAGRLFTSFELQACGRWGLLDPSGRPLARHLPVAVRRDPMVVTTADVPAKLREAAADAWKNLNAIRDRRQAAVDRLAAADDRKTRAAKDRDRRAYELAIADRKATELEVEAIESQEVPLRRAVSDCERRVNEAIWDLQLRRSGLA